MGLICRLLTLCEFGCELLKFRFKFLDAVVLPFEECLEFFDTLGQQPILLGEIRLTPLGLATASIDREVLRRVLSRFWVVERRRILYCSLNRLLAIRRPVGVVDLVLFVTK